jgi:glycyl-tRNA synthetase beta chain
MAELLLEILSEEIPARMQARAAEDLKRLVTDKLKAAGLAFGKAESFVTPRRLALVVDGLPVASPDISEERRGPRVGAPEAALQGFLKAAGVPLDQCEQRDTGNGTFYFAVIKKSGQQTAVLLPDLIRGVVRSDFPWPKSMRFPAATYRWVRPITSVVALFDGRSLALDLDSVAVGDTTYGHRFLDPARFPVASFADYKTKLRSAKVILDQSERRAMIASGLAATAAKAGLSVKDDQGLLEEVMGLVEWPNVLIGAIDDAFMDLPPEVLTTTMRAHQKYFACLNAAGDLAPRFLVVANIETADSGKAIVAGNERVLRARLSDAKFFFDQDRTATLESRVSKLADRTFYAGLGTMRDKSARLGHLAQWLAGFTGADSNHAERAGRLAKADLTTLMVGEFPELQGIMGHYYLLHDKRPLEVARAVADHYAPQGPDDSCPSAPVSVAVALADKIDTLVGFFGIGEKPTGSKDPFALRRAALGAIRLILENQLRVRLLQVFAEARAGYRGILKTDPAADLLAFFADRLKVYLRDKGIRHDLIEAVYALGEDDLVRLVKRTEALDSFLKTDDGANLLTAYRRAANILRIEEKKDGVKYDNDPISEQFSEDAETTLQYALVAVWERDVAPALHKEQYENAMASLSKLRQPVDAFFDKVTVNTPDPRLRINRLNMLSAIVRAMGNVADFSKIEG